MKLFTPLLIQIQADITKCIIQNFNNYLNASDIGLDVWTMYLFNSSMCSDD